MPPLDDDRREVAEFVRRALAIENQLSPVQARLFVRCIQTAWQVPTIQWTARESRAQLDDARRLMHAAEVFRELDGNASAQAVDCYRRAGELLEWLARAGDEVRTIAPVALYAAGAYQLGGLPAMAASLLQRAEADGEARVYADFLRADFDAVLRTCASFWRRHPELTGRNSSADLLHENRDDRLEWYIVVELVRSLGLIADSLRRGDTDRLARAQQKLNGLEKLAARSISEDAWLLVALLQTTTDRYAAASLYLRVLRLAEQSPASAPQLRNFARDQFARGRGILWTSQIHGLDRLIAHSSFALCTPTGSGKTLIATLALVKELLLAPSDELLAPLALYLVPSRALAGEVEQKLTRELSQAGDFIITGLYGGADWGITDYWLTTERPTVLIATVEKADGLMRYLGPILLARLRLLIVDEAHQVVVENNDRTRLSFADHNNRSIRLESFVSRLLALKPDIVRLALTAVAGGAAEPVARWVEGRAEAEPIATRYRSTRQLIGALQGSRGQSGRIVLDLMNGRPLYVRGREDAVYLPLRIPAMPELPAAARNSLNHYNQLHVLWTALHLCEGGRRILISVAQEPETTMRWYAEAFALSGWENISPFVEPEDQFLNTQFQKTRELCVDYCGPESYEVALLDKGVATSHGQMPQRLRRLMTDLVDRRVCPITLATATLTEGVNLPFDLIFVTSLSRSTYDQLTQRPVITPLATSEFRNLAGRAGRPGAADGMEGITLVALPQRPSTTARGQVETQRRQVYALSQAYENLLERLAAEETQQARVGSPLALLLHTIALRVRDLLGIRSADAFFAWLETATPEAVSPLAGTAGTSPDARLADSLDELDGVLLAAVEEFNRAVVDGGVDGAATEAFLVDLWAQTFTRVAAAQEAWLEQAFVRRGRAIFERIYADAPQRRRFYQYGFAPHICRRFDVTAPLIRAQLEAAVDYGVWGAASRLEIFHYIGSALVGERGFGFRVRDTNVDRDLLERWGDVLAWWMQAPGAVGPDPPHLRSWQRFVADNIEFRLGIVIGGVVAQAWSEGAADPFQVPSLAEWRSTTRLPWFGFWARELLRWGTLDPFVAFALAQGHAQSREQAAERRAEFEIWLRQTGEEPIPENLIDPQQFLQWERNLPRAAVREAGSTSSPAVLTGTSGIRRQYGVLPLAERESVTWLDAAGFALATSSRVPGMLTAQPFRHDFNLVVDEQPRVQRVFTARRE
jgi:DEAD/DEAH box helicase